MIPAALIETARMGGDPYGNVSTKIRAYVRSEYRGRGDYALFQIARAGRERPAVKDRVRLGERLDRAYRAFAGRFARRFARSTPVRPMDKPLERRPRADAGGITARP